MTVTLEEQAIAAALAQAERDVACGINPSAEPLRVALHKAVDVIASVSANRDTARAEAATLRAQVAELTDPDNRLRALLDWRGITVPCKVCFGSGRLGYADTATWRGGGGGQMMTDDVCNVCWGSGDAERPGVDLRKLTRHADAARKAERADVVAWLRSGDWPSGPTWQAIKNCIDQSADAIERGAHEGAATPK